MTTSAGEAAAAGAGRAAVALAGLCAAGSATGGSAAGGRLAKAAGTLRWPIADGAEMSAWTCTLIRVAIGDRGALDCGLNERARGKAAPHHDAEHSTAWYE